MKPREKRHKVMIRARMLNGVAWHDICILNCSPHGLGIQAADPPVRGAYVEIRRGQQTIIARVAWRNGHRAGLKSQDAIFVSALVAGNCPEVLPRSPSPSFVERRKAPRPSSVTHSDSRLAGRVMEFASLSIVAFALALAALSAVTQALARPLQAVAVALN